MQPDVKLTVHFDFNTETGNVNVVFARGDESIFSVVFDLMQFDQFSRDMIKLNKEINMYSISRCQESNGKNQLAIEERQNC
jgi:hypothetical protein